MFQLANQELLAAVQTHKVRRDRLTRIGNVDRPPLPNHKPPTHDRPLPPIPKDRKPFRGLPYNRTHIRDFSVRLNPNSMATAPGPPTLSPTLPFSSHPLPVPQTNPRSSPRGSPRFSPIFAKLSPRLSPRGSPKPTPKNVRKFHSIDHTYSHSQPSNAMLPQSFFKSPTHNTQTTPTESQYAQSFDFVDDLPTTATTTLTTTPQSQSQSHPAPALIPSKKRESAPPIHLSKGAANPFDGKRMSGGFRLPPLPQSISTLSSSAVASVAESDAPSSSSSTIHQSSAPVIGGSHHSHTHKNNRNRYDSTTSMTTDDEFEMDSDGDDVDNLNSNPNPNTLKTGRKLIIKSVSVGGEMDLYSGDGGDSTPTARRRKKPPPPQRHNYTVDHT